METINHEFGDETASQFDVKALFFKYIRYWYLFVITIPIGLAGAYIKTKYTRPSYKVGSTILINEDQENPGNNAGALKELFLFNPQLNINNEINILESQKIATLTARELNIWVRYYKIKKTFDAEIYTAAPFIVEFDTAQKNKPFNVAFQISPISLTNYKLETKVNSKLSYIYSKLDGIHRFNEPLSINKFNFTIKSKYNLSDSSYFNKSFYFIISNPLDILNEIRSNLTVEKSGGANGDKDVSILSLSITGDNPFKIVDMLNTLTKVYTYQSLNKKNQKALNTIRFIDNQLGEISDSLHFTENSLQDFKTTNKVMNLDQESSALLDQMQSLNEAKAALIVQNKYYAYLKSYVEKNKRYNDLLIPSTMGVTDPVLNGLVTKLLDLDALVADVQYNIKQKNVVTDKYFYQIENIKNSIIENIKNNEKNVKISLDDIDERMNKQEEEIKKLPQKERQLFGIERKFKLNDDIYTYLLEKRSEAAIAKASNVPDCEIVDEATLNQVIQTAPQSKQNLLFGFFIGLLAPFIFLYLKTILNDKISEKTDIEKITKLPVIGYIIHSFSKTVLAVAEKPKSSLSESFRALRTNIHFMIPNKSKQIILITSSHTSEGKTFTAINLGSILSLSGKKTLLMGFDLRKPRLYQEFGLSNNIGISTYLAGKCSISDAIQHTQLPMLDVIPGGPVPPNPSELIALPKTQQLLDELQKEYDYIVIDTSPVGIVADGFMLMKMTDLNIFLLRHNLSTRKLTSRVLEEIRMNNISNVGIVINDISLSAFSYGYKYNYGYQYNYRYYKSYGYYEEEAVVLPFFKRMYENIKSTLNE